MALAFFVQLASPAVASCVNCHHATRTRPHALMLQPTAFLALLACTICGASWVVRGPASALDGSDGMAGMANFIPYEPQDFLKNADGNIKTFGGCVSAGWSGDDNGHTLAGTVAGHASDSLDWLLTASPHGAQARETRGTNFEPNLNGTAANPQQDSGNSLLGKIVLRPTADQKHTFTLEYGEKCSDGERLSSRTPLPFTGRPSQILGSIVGESASRDMERDRFTWDARFDLAAPWADHMPTVLAVQRAVTRQIGTSARNTLPLRIRDTRWASAPGMRLPAAARVEKKHAGYADRWVHSVLRNDSSTHHQPDT